jgi:hypothetical protein
MLLSYAMSITRSAQMSTGAGDGSRGPIVRDGIRLWSCRARTVEIVTARGFRTRADALRERGAKRCFRSED